MTNLTEISKDYGYCVAKDINKIIAKIDKAIAVVSGMIDSCENVLKGLKNVK